MKEQFNEYLKSLGMTGPIITRVETIYGYVEKMCSHEITDIFITDYIKEDGTREFESLWLLSPGSIIEARQFITQEDIDITPLRKKILYCRIQTKEYNFEKATEKSRMYLIIRFLDIHIKGEFKASKENCDHLWQINLKYFKPNMIE